MKTNYLLLIAALLLTLSGCTLLAPSEPTLQTLIPPTETTAPAAEATQTETPQPAAPTAETTTASGMLDFPIVLIDGTTVRLRDFTGQPVMLLFFSVHCGHCHNESQHLEAIYQEYKAQGFTILAAEVSGAVETDLQDFADEYGITFPLGSDPNDAFAIYMGVTGVPHNFLIDASGSVVDEMRGFSSAEELRSEIETFLGD